MTSKPRVPAIGEPVTSQTAAALMPLAWQFYAVLAVFIITYLLLVEATKKVLYNEPMRVFDQPYRTRGLRHLLERRAARFIHSGTTQ